MSPGPAVAAISAAIGFLLGGLLVDAVTSVLGVVVLVTGLCAAAGREAAVLAGSDHETVKRMTARGFYAGVVASVLVLIADLLWG